MPEEKRSPLRRGIARSVVARILRPPAGQGTGQKRGASTRAENASRKARGEARSPLDAPDGREMDAAYYDDTFHRSEKWLSDYTESHYYPFWAVLADRMTRAGVSSVVDLGCGPGQFAALMRDKGVPRYLGVDFSEARIAQARKACPEYEFLSADIFQSDVLSTRDYDTVVATEFLEHIDRDLDVLDAIRPGARFLGTVPNFGGEGHVRHFQNPEQVRERYSSRFTDLDVRVHRADVKGRAFFLMDGIKN